VPIRLNLQRQTVDKYLTMAAQPLAKTSQLQSYQETIRNLSERIVEAQRPIRVLDALRIPARIMESISASNYRELPSLTAADYRAHAPLGYDPLKKQEELREIILDIERELSHQDPLRHLLVHMAEQYMDVVEMLMNRGTKRFWELSRKLYGSPRDPFHQQDYTVSSLGRSLNETLSKISNRDLGEVSAKDQTAETVVDTLNARFSQCFSGDSVRAKLSDGIIADAAAGGEIVKIRKDSLFSKRDIDVLEVHEGWVHVGTTQNGNAQPFAKWLSKGSPRVVSTQEGLAVLMEILTFNSYPRRAKQINDRILAVEKVEDGANFLELIEFYRVEGYSEHEAIKNTKRVFRGGSLEGGAPFTKDISYCRGFFEVYHFIRAAIRAGKPELIPFLFVGKSSVEDVPLIYQKYLEGVVEFPKFIPPPFRDLNGIAVWMTFSGSLSQNNGTKIQDHYERLFTRHA
jgi:uncharacterized protein (TIGR02421 family)